jgi:hypothetical protein
MRVSTASVFVSILVVAPCAALVSTSTPAQAAARGGAYRVGMQLRARDDCTIQGYAVKKGVVLAVLSVHRDDDGKEVALDLGFRGMTIRGVDVRTIASHFKRT